MKKKLIFVLGFILVFNCLHAELSDKDKAEAKIKSWDDKVKSKSGQVYLFSGFNFEKYEKGSTSLSDIIEAEYNIFKATTSEEMTYTNKYGETNKVSPPSQDGFIIVGHSQGGLRVLAFATYLYEKDRELFKKLKGIVTVSGITKGLKALDGGFGPIRRQVYDCIYTLSDGFYGCIAVFFCPVGELFGQLLEPFFVDGLSNAGYNIIISVLENKLPYIGLILDGLPEDEVPEIRDMIPQSEFIKKNVVETKNYTYRVQTGTERHLRWKKVTNRWGWKYWALRWHYSPVYKLYTNCLHTTKFPTEPKDSTESKFTPVGYIVGTKNDTFSMAKEETSKAIDKGAKVVGGVMATGAGVHVLKCVGLVGLFTGSPRYAANCIKASKLCFGYKSKVNEILKSNEHDGLVAKESQYIPSEEMDFSKTPATIHKIHKSIKGNKDDHDEFFCNHAEIIDDPQVKERIKFVLDELIE